MACLLFSVWMDDALHHINNTADLHWFHYQGAVQDTFQPNTLEYPAEALYD